MILDILARPVVIVLLAVGALALAWGSGYSYSRNKYEAVLANAKVVAGEIKAETKIVTVQVEAAAAAEKVVIKRVFVDRVEYRDREVPVEIRIREDAECVVPERFIRMWNSANRATVPDAAGGPDGSAHRAEGSAAPAEREAVGHRGAAREGSDGDAPKHGAAPSTDQLDPKAAGSLRPVNETMADPQRRVGVIVPGLAVAGTQLAAAARLVPPSRVRAAPFFVLQSKIDLT